MFIHNVETFQSTWEKVGERIGTRSMIEAHLVDLNEWGPLKEGM